MKDHEVATPDLKMLEARVFVIKNGMILIH